MEVFTGNTKLTTFYADYQVEHKNFVRGVVQEVVDDCLVLEVSANNTKTLIYLNSWQIVAILKPIPGIAMKDVYCADNKCI